MNKSTKGATAALRGAWREAMRSRYREYRHAERPCQAPEGPVLPGLHEMRRWRCRAPRHRSGAWNRSPRGPRKGDRAAEGVVTDRAPGIASRSTVASPKGPLLRAARSGYDLRRPSSHHPHFATNALHRRLVQRFLRYAACACRRRGPPRASPRTATGGRARCVRCPPSSRRIPSPP